MTAPTAADYALVDKHGGTHKEAGGPFSFLWRAECAAALAELRAEMQAKLDAERKLADTLATPQACDGSGSMHIPHFTEEGEDDGVEYAQCEGCCACAHRAHAAARKEG